SDIAPNTRQPRTRFDADELEALTSSIRERGVLQPPIVRELAGGRFELIAGERRWRAAQLAGLTEIEVLIRETDDSGALQDALVENVMRRDLSPVEQARAYATLIDDLQITREELGHRLGLSRASISNHLRLLDLPDDVLELLDRGEPTFAHGRALLLCDDNQTRRALARKAVAEGLSKRQLEDAARSAGAPRTRPQQSERVPADRQAVADRLEDAIGRASGLAVSVRASPGDRYVFTLHGREAAERAAAMLGGGPA
ncbi:MAG: ParB/RepB/Spo0J family partition protein, partial [Gaiellaceae bacterium]